MDVGEAVLRGKLEIERLRLRSQALLPPVVPHPNSPSGVKIAPQNVFIRPPSSRAPSPFCGSHDVKSPPGACLS